MSPDLPARPNFSAIDAAAPRSADRRTKVLAMIGNLVFTWSNNESMFIYILMLLLQTDQTSAAIVFSTLNTTRARLDLVQRLARVKITDPSVMSKLEDVIERFNQCTRVRNEFNHCMYSVNESGEITHTHAMKLQDVRGRLRFGEVKKMDDRRLDEMSEIVRDLKDLNRDIWDFLPLLKQHCESARGPDADRQV
jgi:hypothetical protein